MSTGWENHEPAPLEFFHGELMKEFHMLRLAKGNNPQKTLTLTGSEFGNLVAKVKMETYNKYPKQVSQDAVPKNEL